jgi:spore germination protein YaaH
VWGYVPDFDRAAAWSTAQANRAALSGVSLFQYHLGANGQLIEYPGVGGAPTWVAQRGLAVVPMITNHIENRWDRDVVARVLGDPNRRRQHVDRIITLAVNGGYPRIELDYESLSATDREPFSAFVEELAAALHARGKQLSVAVHAKLAEPGEWDGPQAQDWSRIGAAADWVIVMTYDHDPSRPGPIAPLEWTRAVLRFATTRIPPGKIIQGIPLYGYDWSRNARAVDRTYSQLLDLARARGGELRRDEVDRHLTLEYTDRGVRHEVWFADAETVAALTEIGREVGVAGYALWRLGGEDPSVWALLQGIAR